MLTLSERERRAYIAGNTETAEILGALDAAQCDVEELDAQVYKLHQRTIELENELAETRGA